MNDPHYWSLVDRFNAMYGLPRPEAPTDHGNGHLERFRSIILEEIEELDEILEETDERKRLVALADWLGDLIIYCSTEARRHGLPMDKVLSVIMDSNFSKLGADGKPIYDERGKVMKGPNFWTPEPEIERILFGNDSR